MLARQPMGAHTMRQGMFMVEPEHYGGASVVEARKASKDYQREPLKRQGWKQKMSSPTWQTCPCKQGTAKSKELRINPKATPTNCPSGGKEVEPVAANTNTNTNIHSCITINTTLTERAATDSPQNKTRE